MIHAWAGVPEARAPRGMSRSRARLDPPGHLVASCRAVDRATGRLGGLLSAIVALSACGTDLGECDMAAATRVVYRAGIPYFEGQAVVETNCAGSFCHTGTADGADRLGVPAGLNFDVTVVTPGMGVDAARRHGRGHDTISEWSEQMLAQVKAGTMPPGKAGKRAPETWLHELPDGSLPTAGASELYDVRTAQGEETLRNWLACGHPTVAGTSDLEPSVRAEVDALGGVVLPPQGLEECVPIGSVVYAQLLDTGGCLGCHFADSPNVPEHQLDLSRDADGSLASAYAQVFDQPARGSECKPSGLKLIDPGNCQNSLLYQKLKATPPAAPGPFDPTPVEPVDDGVCGDFMPPTRFGPFPAELLDCLCEWIDAGALPN